MRRELLVLAGALLVVESFATPSGAEEPRSHNGHGDVAVDHESADDVRVLVGDEAYDEDAATLAASTGRSVDEIRDALRFQEEVRKLVHSLPPEVLSGSYAGGELSMSSTPRATLYFTGDVPLEARQLTASSDLVGVELRGGMKRTLDELALIQKEIHDAVAMVGFTSVVSRFELASQVVTVDVATKGAAPSLQGAALLRQVRESVTARGVALDEAEFEENNSSGGTNLTFPAPFAAEHVGTYGDVEWHTTTNHDDYPEFWADVNQRRRVTGVISNSDIFDDAYVCNFGRTSGYKCG